MSEPTSPTIVLNEPHYPALTTLARHAKLIAPGAAVFVFVAILLATFQALGVGAMALAALVAALTYGAAAVLGEVARLLVETLIPK